MKKTLHICLGGFMDLGSKWFGVGNGGCLDEPGPRVCDGQGVYLQHKRKGLFGNCM